MGLVGKAGGVKELLACSMICDFLSSINIYVYLLVFQKRKEKFMSNAFNLFVKV